MDSEVRMEGLYSSPTSVLTRQASNMGWRASRTITDSEGYRNTCLKRDGLEVMISFKKGKDWEAPFLVVLNAAAF